MIKLKTSIFLFAYLGVSAGNSHALLIGDVELRDGNSTATFTSFENRHGTEINGLWRDWTTDGINNLWLGRTIVGLSGERKSPIDVWDVDNFNVQDTNSDGDDDSFFIQHSRNGMQTSSLYTLSGNAPGSNLSSMSQAITITNNSSSSLDLQLFQMIDFDLGDNSIPNHWTDEFTMLNSPTHITQWDETTAVSLNIDSDLTHWLLGGGRFGRYIHHGLPMPDNNNFGPGDAKWLLQWDVALNTGDSFQLNQRFNISPSSVPSPSILFLLLAGLLLTPLRTLLIHGRNKPDQ